MGQLSVASFRMTFHLASNWNRSFHDVTSKTANKTEDINGIKGNILLLHDVKTISSNKAKLLKIVYMWLSCNVTFPWKMHVYNHIGFSGTILTIYRVEGCVQTLLFAFWDCFRSWVKIVRRDWCLSTWLGQRPFNKNYFDRHLQHSSIVMNYWSKCCLWTSMGSVHVKWHCLTVSFHQMRY